MGEAEKTEDDKIAADKRAAAAAEAKAQADTKVLGALVMSLRRFWMSNIMPCFTKNTADLLTLVLVLFTSLAHLCNLSSTLGEVRKGFFIIKSFASVLQILKILNFMRGFEKFAWVVGVIQQNTVDMIEVSQRAALVISHHRSSASVRVCSRSGIVDLELILVLQVLR